VFAAFGGIHRFMRWDGAVLTDSGGYQIFSLPSERQIGEEGAAFRSQHDNHRHLLSPEKSIAVQQAIGSEIMMVLDVCVDSRTDEHGTREAMERTHRWALRSLAERDRRDTGQALFAIVQGGVFPALRRQSAAVLTGHPFDGFAIGGLAVGETREEREGMTEVVTALLPRDRPRYLMGVGTPLDLLEAVRRGVDLFDCILPTKMAQQGYAYTFAGPLRLTRQVHRLSGEPIEAGCGCAVCARFARGYLHHLLKARQIQGPRMLALHNTHHYQELMRRMRRAILEDRFEAFYRRARLELSGALGDEAESAG
jgi:queuine tRNA-ribosyltransferase